MKTTKGITEVGRLAMRHEGAHWNAYYASTETMEGAILLGSIAMRFIIKNPDMKEAFMGLMRSAVSELLEEVAGEPVLWHEPTPAPARERSGHG